MEKQTHPTWQRAKGHRIFRSGDKMYVHVPGRKNAKVVTFKAHTVTPTSEYLEVSDDMKSRFVGVDAFVRGAK